MKRFSSGPEGARDDKPKATTDETVGLDALGAERPKAKTEQRRVPGAVM
ncbi:MAG: hypothetical protein KI792_03410 [Alphaproteobacteria bacterium]|nr:hypothetical protein [Alphaproteobacteria bacterium SS10]